MSQLKFVEHTDAGATLNICLYGGPKVGKSTGAASAPGRILYVNADTQNALRFARQRSSQEIGEVKATGLQTLISVIHALEGKHDFATVVIDPVGELYRVVLEDLSGRALTPQIQDYGAAGTHVERFCRALCENQSVNVVFVLHEMKEKNEEDGSFERLPFASTKSGSAVAAAKLMAMVDVIGYCGILEGEGDAEDRYVAQLIDAKGRRGGDRTGKLGKLRDLDLSEWVAVAQDATVAQTTTESRRLDSNKKEQK